MSSLRDKDVAEPAMRLRNCIIVMLIAFVGLAVFGVGVPKSAAPVQVSVVNVAELENTKRVTVEFLRRDPAARFTEAHQLQIRVAGRWQPPLSLPRFAGGYLFTQTNSQRLVFDFPRQTEACRFLLGYRVGRRPYCQAYFFLWRHGVAQKFPAISKAILKCVSKYPRLRRFECELEIPAGTHGNIAAASLRTAGQLGSSGNLSATLAADRNFPAVVADR